MFAPLWGPNLVYAGAGRHCWSLEDLVEAVSSRRGQPCAFGSRRWEGGVVGGGWAVLSSRQRLLAALLRHPCSSEGGAATSCGRSWAWQLCGSGSL
jgi:hypothetical protein